MAKIKDDANLAKWKVVGRKQVTAQQLMGTLSTGSQMDLRTTAIYNIGSDLDEGFFWYQDEVLSDTQVGERWGAIPRANGGRSLINVPADCHYIDMAHYILHDIEWANNSQPDWEERPVLLTVLACDSYQSYQYRVTPLLPTEGQPEPESLEAESGPGEAGKPGRPKELNHAVPLRGTIEGEQDYRINQWATRHNMSKAEALRALLEKGLTQE